MDFLALFDKEINEAKPDHYYFAQIASEISCLPFLVWGKEPPKELRDLKTWMLKFGDPEEIARKAEEMALKRAQQDAEFSRSVWMAGLGIEMGPDGKPVPREKKKDGPPRTLPPHVRQMPVPGSVEANTGFPRGNETLEPVSSDFVPQAKPERPKRRSKTVVKGVVTDANL